ncbi:MAG TPA: Uma2 family endonuclease [Pyrinomonadaceae bacterium]|nr:Uma2 family endonuclease [Pyrinomonadaceae bacterium]
MTQAILEQPLTEPRRHESLWKLHLRPAVDLTDDQYFALCQINRELRLERTAEGDLIIMPPTGAETGNRNSEINRQFGNWAKQDGSGAAFGSSTGFKLPNGADRSPDEGWVLFTRLAELTAEQKLKFLPLAPDFAIELKSPTDALQDLLAKMEEYRDNGVRLGWLINPDTRQVYIYRPGRDVEVSENPLEISAEPELPGFVLDLREIWEPNI